MNALLGKRAARQNVFHFAGAMRKTVGFAHKRSDYKGETK